MDHNKSCNQSQSFSSVECQMEAYKAVNWTKSLSVKVDPTKVYEPVYMKYFENAVKNVYAKLYSDQDAVDKMAGPLLGKGKKKDKVVCRKTHKNNIKKMNAAEYHDNNISKSVDEKKDKSLPRITSKNKLEKMTNASEYHDNKVSKSVDVKKDKSVPRKTRKIKLKKIKNAAEYHDNSVSTSVDDSSTYTKPQYSLGSKRSRRKHFPASTLAHLGTKLSSPRCPLHSNTGSMQRFCGIGLPAISKDTAIKNERISDKSGKLTGIKKGTELQNFLGELKMIPTSLKCDREKMADQLRRAMPRIKSFCSDCSEENVNQLLAWLLKEIASIIKNDKRFLKEFVEKLYEESVIEPANSEVDTTAVCQSFTNCKCEVCQFYSDKRRTVIYPRMNMKESESRVSKKPFMVLQHFPVT